METLQEDLPLSRILELQKKLQWNNILEWREIRKQGTTLRAQFYRMKEDLFKDVPWELIAGCHRIPELAPAYDRMLKVGTQVKKLLNFLDENPNDQDTYNQVLVVIVEMHDQCVGILNSKSTSFMQGGGI